MLAGMGMLRKRLGWEVRNIASNYSNMLLENPPGTQVHLSMLKHLQKSGHQPAAPDVKKTLQQSEKSERCKKDKFLLPLAK